MKRYIKALAGYFGLLKLTIISILRIIIYSRRVTKIKKLKINDNHVLYILGNGPSLKENVVNDLDLLKTKELFVVNDFAKSKYFEVLQPKYYVLLDPCYWSTEYYKEFLDDSLVTLNKIRDTVNWPLNLIVPHEAYKTKSIRDIFSNNHNINLIDFNATSVSGFTWFKNFIYKNYLGIPPVNNVVGACIYLAINLQYREINLLGADHSWTRDLVVNEKNQVCTGNPHFYDETNSIAVPFKTAYGDFYSMHKLLRDFALMFEGYHTLKKYSEYRNVKIFNRCKKSYIDAFERKDLYSE